MKSLTVLAPSFPNPGKMGWEDGVFAEREPPFPRSEMDRMVAEGAKRMGLHIRAAAKGSENLVRMLNEAIARELVEST